LQIELLWGYQGRRSPGPSDDCFTRAPAVRGGVDRTHWLTRVMTMVALKRRVVARTCYQRSPGTNPRALAGCSALNPSINRATSGATRTALDSCKPCLRPTGRTVGKLGRWIEAGRMVRRPKVLIARELGTSLAQRVCQLCHPYEGQIGGCSPAPSGSTRLAGRLHRSPRSVSTRASRWTRPTSTRASTPTVISLTRWGAARVVLA
jgi:hypothetical protein